MDKEIKELRDEMKAIHKIALENKKATKDNAKDIKDNFDRINQNTFVLDIIRDYKQEIDTLKDIVKTNKKTIKVMSIVLIILVILFAFVCIHHFFF